MIVTQTFTYLLWCLGSSLRRPCMYTLQFVAVQLLKQGPDSQLSENLYIIVGDQHLQMVMVYTHRIN